MTELPFFATKVRLGRGGAEEIYQLGPLNEYERYRAIVKFSHSFHSRRQPEAVLIILKNVLTGLGWRKQRRSLLQASTREFPSLRNDSNFFFQNYQSLVVYEMDGIRTSNYKMPADVIFCSNSSKFSIFTMSATYQTIKNKLI